MARVFSQHGGDGVSRRVNLAGLQLARGLGQPCFVGAGTAQLGLQLTGARGLGVDGLHAGQQRLGGVELAAGTGVLGLRRQPEQADLTLAQQRGAEFRVVRRAGTGIAQQPPGSLVLASASQGVGLAQRGVGASAKQQEEGDQKEAAHAAGEAKGTNWARPSGM